MLTQVEPTQTRVEIPPEFCHCGKHLKVFPGNQFIYGICPDGHIKLTREWEAFEFEREYADNAPFAVRAHVGV